MMSKIAYGIRSKGLRVLRYCASAAVAAALSLTLSASAAIPPPEKMLPEDTLVLLTIPDFAKLRQIYESSPQGQLFNDPAMKPFKTKFLEKWKEEFVEPLERELNIRFDDYTNLPQGQVTFALTQNGSEGKESDRPGALLLVDTKGQSNQLKSNLTELRRKWIDSGKSIKTEKIRDLEFSVLQLSSNDIPKTLRKLFPPAPQLHELGEEEQSEKPEAKSEFVIGQFESLLIAGNSLKVVEKIVNRLSGSAIPSLGELAAYDANHQAMFRDAPAYGWVNMKLFVEMLGRSPSEKKSSDVPDPFGMAKPEKILAATGFSALKTLAVNFRNASDGILLQAFIGVPEANRQGLFKILAGEPKEYNPPPFIPADAVKFQRWRIDGQKAWSTLEKMLNEISPQMASSLSFLIDMANTAAKEKEPGFDVRKNLIGNLGDDMLSYEKAPKPVAGASSGPSIFLLGSPNPEQLVASLNGIFIAVNQGNPPNEREFLGRKISSLPLPNIPVPIPGVAGRTSSGKPSTLSYAVSGGYVAMSTDPAMLEEYLRSSESQGKTLRESAGLSEATQRVTGPGTSLFGYQNYAETMRNTFESLKKNPSSANSTLDALPTPFGVGNAVKTVRGWMDFSLLPSFDRVAKYFNFTVYGGSATVDGLTLKVFAPTPLGVKQ